MKKCLSCNDYKKLGVCCAEIIEILTLVHLFIHDGFLYFDDIRLNVLAQMDHHVLQIPPEF